ncbi:MAG TPA: DUF5666 domain-containing protein, partial [Nitrosomonas sp.]|nr:DUF5666 domain-containing protein [Nitrosomonas sp.]
DFEVPIIVLGATEIESNGYHIPLSELEVGDVVKINGFFGEDGIVAESIYVLDGGLGKFRLRGLIKGVEPVEDGIFMQVLGIDILVDESTSIRSRGLGVVNNLPISALQVGESVDVKGRYLDDTFFADRVEVGKRPDEHVRVKGKIIDLTNDIIEIVTIHEAHLIVVRTGTTKIYGSLAEGEFVEVEGYLNQKLDVIAEKIIVDDDRNGYSRDYHHYESKRSDDDRFGVINRNYGKHHGKKNGRDKDEDRDD